MSHLGPSRCATATDWLARYRAYWEESYERLDELVARLQADPPAEEPPADDEEGATP